MATKEITNALKKIKKVIKKMGVKVGDPKRGLDFYLDSSRGKGAHLRLITFYKGKSESTILGQNNPNNSTYLKKKIEKHLDVLGLFDDYPNVGAEFPRRVIARKPAVNPRTGRISKSVGSSYRTIETYKGMPNLYFVPHERFKYWSKTKRAEFLKVHKSAIRKNWKRVLDEA